MDGYPDLIAMSDFYFHRLTAVDKTASSMLGDFAPLHYVARATEELWSEIDACWAEDSVAAADFKYWSLRYLRGHLDQLEERIGADMRDALALLDEVP